MGVYYQCAVFMKILFENLYVGIFSNYTVEEILLLINALGDRRSYSVLYLETFFDSFSLISLMYIGNDRYYFFVIISSFLLFLDGA